MKTAFDIQITAGFYSQMSGVLAGFGFAAVPIILSRRREITDDDNSVILSECVTALLCGFFALVLTTLLYSVLAGTDDSYPGASAEEIFAGLGFGLGILSLFHGITMLLETTFEQAAIAFGRVTVIVIPPLLLFYVGLGGNDVRTARLDCRHPSWGWVVPVCADLPALLLIMVPAAALLLPSTRLKRFRASLFERSPRLTQNHLSFATVIVTVAASVAVGEISPNTLLSESVVVVLFLGIAGYLALWQSTFLRSRTVSLARAPKSEVGGPTIVTSAAAPTEQ